MNFANIASGASLFLDANVFVYDFGHWPDVPWLAATRSLRSGAL